MLVKDRAVNVEALLAKVEALTKKLDQAIEERDEARVLCCMETAAVEFMARGQERQRTLREIANERWPGEGDRLFSTNRWSRKRHQGLSGRGSKRAKYAAEGSGITTATQRWHG